MPGMTGPELQQELKNRRQEIPIIFITAQKTRLFAPECRTGCDGVLFKPSAIRRLSDAVNAALDELNLSDTSCSKRGYMEFSERTAFRIRFADRTQSQSSLSLDDDISVREITGSADPFLSGGNETFASAEEFLTRPRPVARAVWYLTFSSGAQRS